jgi:hypothetical protein
MTDNALRNEVAFAGYFIHELEHTTSEGSPVVPTPLPGEPYEAFFVRYVLAFLAAEVYAYTQTPEIMAAIYPSWQTPFSVHPGFPWVPERRRG